MKKILPLLLSLFAFVACDNVSNNNADSVSIDTEAVTTECTITVEDPTTIVLSDGTWSIVLISKSNSKYHAKQDCTVEAKEGIYTVTYFKQTDTFDLSDRSDEEIEELKNKTNEELGYPSDASVIWNNDKTVTISIIATKEQLHNMEQNFNFSKFSGADVKTNVDNTKYVVDSNNDGTYVLYYSKN